MRKTGRSVFRMAVFTPSGNRNGKGRKALTEKRRLNPVRGDISQEL